MGTVILLMVIFPNMYQIDGRERTPSLKELLQKAELRERIAVLVPLKERFACKSLKNLFFLYSSLNILENNISYRVDRKFKDAFDIGITLGYLENKKTDGISIGGVGNIRFFTFFNLQTGIMKNFFSSSPHNEQRDYNITGELSLNLELAPTGIYLGAGITNLGALFYSQQGFELNYLRNF